MPEEPTNDRPLLLQERLNAITQDIGSVAKEGRNDHFKYAFVQDVDVLNAVRPYLVQYRVNIIGAVKGVERFGNKTCLDLEYTVSSTDVPGDSVVIPWHCEAIDAQDKGVNKALTSGYKYFLLKLFFIATGDEEADAGPATKPVAASSKTASEATAAQAQDHLKTLNLTPDQKKEFISTCSDTKQNWTTVALNHKKLSGTNFAQLIQLAQRAGDPK